MTRVHKFFQIDVFASESPLSGNPVAVVFDADDLTTEEMQKCAHWQNLSETTFVLKPTHPEADYKLRIFTPDFELPFAGHPTLGSARALLSSGLKPKKEGIIVQECGKGLISIKIEDKKLLFSSPEAKIDVYGGDLLSRALGAPNLSLTGAIVDVGPKWLVVPLDSAEMVRATEINGPAFTELTHETKMTGITFYGAEGQDSSAGHKYEVRSVFLQQSGVIEDPVCGSGNAAVARYLETFGERSSYVARQGTCLGRNGLVSVEYAEDNIWVGGEAKVTTSGQIFL